MFTVDYYICHKCDDGNWSLWRVCGTDKEKAEKILEEEKESNPTEELILRSSPSHLCWWNDPTMG